MKPRHFLARIAALVTAAAAIAMFGPASAEAANHPPDGRANRDPDVAADGLGSAMTQAVASGSELDGWANRDLDIAVTP